MQESAHGWLRVHAGLDYAFVVIGFAAPWLFGFAERTSATLYTLALAAFGLGLNLVTDYPGGVWRRLPLRWHRVVEWTTPAPFVLAPWVFFADAGAMPYVLGALGVGIVTNAWMVRTA